jgi:RNA polymerase sigma factor (sigma-70 family)
MVCEPMHSPEDLASSEEFSARWVSVRLKVSLFCLRRLGDTNDADDAVQTVAFHAWSGYQSLRDPSRFEAWVRAIAANVVSRKIRERIIFRNRLISLEDDYESSEPERAAEPSPANLDWALQAIQNATQDKVLTRKEQAVLELHLRSNEAHWYEIGASLGLSAGDCATTHFRAIPKLRAYVLCHHKELLGGTKALGEALQTSRISAHEPVTAFENEVFREQVLAGNSQFRPSGWRTALRSACNKVVKHLHLEMQQCRSIHE